jgi:polyphosphate:AMP phosphotransferase
MLESAEVGHSVTKAAFDRAVPKLREALLNAQFDLRDKARGPVIVLLSGLAGGGRSEIANRLSEWMDPRFMQVVAFGPRTCEEREHPAAWRYWMALPPRGRIGILMNAWYSETLAEHAQGGSSLARLDVRLQRIREHEQMLVDEGATFVKIWLHMRKADLKRKLSRLDDDPDTSWRVTREHWDAYRFYTSEHELFEHVLRETSTGAAPWTVVEGVDDRYRDITAGKLVLAALRSAATGSVRAVHAAPPVVPEAVDNVKMLRDLDLSQSIAEKDYEREVERWQRSLAKATRGKGFRKRSLVLVFEGVDAAGKGGAVRRVVNALDARQYRIVPIAAPTDEERAHPYLWRFWRQVPRDGGITVFDRSWYGRVLVERVEGFCSEADWLRAYDEINRFEEDLTRAGAVVVKLWLHIGQKEQLARFNARAQTSFKRFKITEEDWRNRRKWPRYEHAIADMIDRTSTEIAPWTLVEAEDKHFARVKVLRTIVERLKAARRSR